MWKASAVQPAQKAWWRDGPEKELIRPRLLLTQTGLSQPVSPLFKVEVTAGELGMYVVELLFLLVVHLDQV